MPFDGAGQPTHRASSSDALDRLVGTLIDRRYRVEREVGAGGYGTVYSAFHVGLGAQVAVKVLRLPDRVGPERLGELVGGFLEEARTLKRLRHPNIVAALDVGLLPGSGEGLRIPYLVMDWCGGPTLGRHLAARGHRPLSLPEAWRLFEPMLAAMTHAHAAGVAHRDLKPSNILLERDAEDGTMRPRIIDFGIAKLFAPDESAGTGSTSTSADGRPFTPRYAAPEQLAGARTGPWTDVYALALLFVEMVSGRPAIGSNADAMLAVFDPVRPTPGALGVDVGPLEAVLLRALALRPAERYPDAAAFARAMRAAAEPGWREPGDDALVTSSADLREDAQPVDDERIAGASTRTDRTDSLEVRQPPVAGEPARASLRERVTHSGTVSVAHPPPRRRSYAAIAIAVAALVVAVGWSWLHLRSDPAGAAAAATAGAVPSSAPAPDAPPEPAAAAAPTALASEPSPVPTAASVRAATVAASPAPRGTRPHEAAGPKAPPEGVAAATPPPAPAPAAASSSARRPIDTSSLQGSVVDDPPF